VYKYANENLGIRLTIPNNNWRVVDDANLLRKVLFFVPDEEKEAINFVIVEIVNGVPGREIMCTCDVSLYAELDELSYFVDTGMPYFMQEELNAGLLSGKQLKTHSGIVCSNMIFSASHSLVSQYYVLANNLVIVFTIHITEQGDDSDSILKKIVMSIETVQTNSVVQRFKMNNMYFNDEIGFSLLKPKGWGLLDKNALLEISQSEQQGHEIDDNMLFSLFKFDNDGDLENMIWCVDNTGMGIDSDEFFSDSGKKKLLNSLPDVINAMASEYDSTDKLLHSLPDNAIGMKDAYSSANIDIKHEFMVLRNGLRCLYIEFCLDDIIIMVYQMFVNSALIGFGAFNMYENDGSTFKSFIESMEIISDLNASEKLP